LLQALARALVACAPGRLLARGRAVARGVAAGAQQRPQARLRRAGQVPAPARARRADQGGHRRQQAPDRLRCVPQGAAPRAPAAHGAQRGRAQAQVLQAGLWLGLRGNVRRDLGLKARDGGRHGGQQLLVGRPQLLRRGRDASFPAHVARLCMRPASSSGPERACRVQGACFPAAACAGACHACMRMQGRPDVRQAEACWSCKRDARCTLCVLLQPAAGPPAAAPALLSTPAPASAPCEQGCCRACTPPARAAQQRAASPACASPQGRR
jgi:hypothetical protein